MEWHLDDGILKEADESGNTKGEDIVAEAIINLLLAALVLLFPLLLEDEVLGVIVDGGIEDEVFLLDSAPVGLPAPLFCHNKALNGLSAALAPLLMTPPKSATAKDGSQACCCRSLVRLNALIEITSHLVRCLFDASAADETRSFEEVVVAGVGVAEEPSTRPELIPEVSVKEEEPTPAPHSRSIESSRKEASNTSSSSTVQVVSSTTNSVGQGQGVVLPVSYSSPPPFIDMRSSVPVRDEAAADDRR